MRLTAFTVVVGTAEEASAVLGALEEQKNCTVEYELDKRAAQMQTVSHEQFDYEFTVRPYDQTTPRTSSSFTRKSFMRLKRSNR